MHTVLIFGATGYIGSYLQKLYPDAACPKGDISDRRFVMKALSDYQPTIVVNAAGKTGRPNVDWCEDHKEETVRANVIGPLVLVEECLKRDIYFVHIGSGCIYTGESPKGGFTEKELPNFSGSFYSLTKYTSDLLLQRFPVLNLRLRMPFDGTRNERNLIMKLLKYQKVLDQPNSLTYIPDFLHALQTLIERREVGTFHVVNPEPLSPFEIVSEYTKTVDPSHTHEKLTLDNLLTVVKAPRSNCILSSKKLQDLGVRLRPSHEALEEALDALKRT